jgi:hypothetical protein
MLRQNQCFCYDMPNILYDYNDAYRVNLYLPVATHRHNPLSVRIGGSFHRHFVMDGGTSAS